MPLHKTDEYHSVIFSFAKQLTEYIASGRLIIAPTKFVSFQSVLIRKTVGADIIRQPSISQRVDSSLWQKEPKILKQISIP